MKKVTKDRKVQNLLPAEYINYLNEVESFESITGRMLLSLREVHMQSTPNQATILITHGSLLGFLTYAYSRQFIEEIKPGEFVQLHTVGERLQVVKAGTLTQRGNQA